MMSATKGMIINGETNLAESAKANIPTAFGAAADVPPWLCEHLFFPTSVVAYKSDSIMALCFLCVLTYDVLSTS